MLYTKLNFPCFRPLINNAEQNLKKIILLNNSIDKLLLKFI